MGKENTGREENTVLGRREEKGGEHGTRRKEEAEIGEGPGTQKELEHQLEKMENTNGQRTQ